MKTELNNPKTRKSRNQKKTNPVNNLINEFEKHTKIWKPKRIKTVHPIIESTVRNLASLEIIKYVRFDENSVQASNELGGNKIKIPTTKSFHPTAVGVHIIYDFEYNYMEFFEMNSAQKGWGEKLVKASIEDLPEDWEATLVFDWSNGFWNKMQEKYNDVKWVRL